ncbi:hypothetical protein EGI22_12610 [Lacihabitans sp. LS3-19]|uniref:hypothetical protein n=1 Tax=Lacihabitans sp. LS3-19 TaxID=2487335 RepID=UPI0020CEFDEF|nr:hypothetical protein [Lacihabitans sp. LS3-19]MCP9768760.1 hypothetical protein [Lacihabitans sp. LS3-19]
MGLFYSATDKELLELRNKVFLAKGIQALIRNNFEKSLFRLTTFGRNNLNDFQYEFCRIDKNKFLLFVNIDICRGDKYVQIYLNIFELHPNPLSLDNLLGLNGLEFRMYPNSNSRMRLRVDDSRGIPVLNLDLFKQHKIRTYFTKTGLIRELERLGNLLEDDLLSIDSFIKRWHEMHNPTMTDWEGNII